ncbi:VOC family protein [Lujinxingia litoralis]|nr:VOC family protein [Lujinxingia litoralis]
MDTYPRLSALRLRVRHLAPLLRFYKEVVGLAAEHQSEAGQVALGGEGASPILKFEEAPDAPERPEHSAGLFHLALRVPDRGALGGVLQRIEEAGYRLWGASDHRVSEALYLRDPGGHGLEIYRDRPEEEWPVGSDGRVQMETLALDLEALRGEANAGEAGEAPEIELGHVHLEVSDLAAMQRFCEVVLGMKERARQPDAIFLAWGGYHHHIAANVWRRCRLPARPDALGLAAICVAWETRAEVEAALQRAAGEHALGVEAQLSQGRVIGPDGIRWELASGAR